MVEMPPPNHQLGKMVSEPPIVKVELQLVSPWAAAGRVNANNASAVRAKPRLRG
jgi:hypothetical protein